MLICIFVCVCSATRRGYGGGSCWHEVWGGKRRERKGKRGWKGLTEWLGEAHTGRPVVFSFWAVNVILRAAGGCGTRGKPLVALPVGLPCTRFSYSYIPQHLTRHAVSPAAMHPPDMTPYSGDSCFSLPVVIFYKCSPAPCQLSFPSVPRLLMLFQARLYTCLLQYSSRVSLPLPSCPFPSS